MENLEDKYNFDNIVKRYFKDGVIERKRMRHINTPKALLQAYPSDIDVKAIIEKNDRTMTVILCNIIELGYEELLLGLEHNDDLLIHYFKSGKPYPHIETINDFYNHIMNPKHKDNNHENSIFKDYPTNMKDVIYITGDFDLKDVYKKYCKWDSKYKQWKTTLEQYKLLKKELEDFKYYKVPYVLKDDFDLIGKWKGNKGYLVGKENFEKAEELLEYKVVDVPYDYIHTIKSFKTRHIHKSKWVVYKQSFDKVDKILALAQS